MREADLTEWLANPATKTLVAYLRRKQAATLQRFLAAQPVDPVTQGQAAALHELEKLLTSSPDDVRKTFETTLREHK